mmetsp:Transcript_32673/g.45575  ORF Transcript_32673/g.45575 Transcript_32673/m.45575 type:complete len:88 (+) Transcript_32673:71-334(+)
MYAYVKLYTKLTNVIMCIFCLTSTTAILRRNCRSCCVALRSSFSAAHWVLKVYDYGSYLFVAICISRNVLRIAKAQELYFPDEVAGV